MTRKATKQTTGSEGLNELEQEARRAEAGAQMFEAVQEPEPEQAAPAYTMEAAQYAAIWRVGFGIIARRAGEHWALTETEAQQLGELTAPVVAKWVPAVMMKYGAEITLASSVVFIVLDRIGRTPVRADNAQTGGSDNHPRETGERKNDARQVVDTERPR